MPIKKIVTENDYSQALQRVEELMYSAEPTSPEWEELEQLSKEIEKYENDHYVFIDPAHRLAPTSTANLDKKITTNYIKRMKGNWLKKT